ncbi:MAG: DUF1810 domain-containing protein [Gammaproteobacteria bacterium]|nr:DUF1810 domain-containing protein [Gammaproteobacteria bacterium]
MNDTFNLQRFIAKQESTYETVLKELQSGKKQTCWMWYIFPQIRGLGHSATARQFAINSKEEAIAYLGHLVLGERLRLCTQLVINIDSREAIEIFSYPDNLKFRSSMTLFNHIDENSWIFERALLKYYEGKPDELTLKILNEL